MLNSQVGKQIINLLKITIMTTLQLFKDGKELLASDGIMYVDGRYSMNRIKDEVRKRNEQFAANFPHKIADSFAIYVNGVGSVRTHPIYLDSAKSAIGTVKIDSSNLTCGIG